MAKAAQPEGGRMPLFIAVCTDRPYALEQRLAVREHHLAWVLAQGAGLRMGGPMMDREGRPVGSVFIWEGESQAAVEALAGADPYMQAGIFESVIWRPFRVVIQDGARVGA
jgi:hypothetical protein